MRHMTHIRHADVMRERTHRRGTFRRGAVRRGAFRRWDISPLGHFAVGTFRRQGISPLGHIAVGTFRRPYKWDISPSIYFKYNKSLISEFLKLLFHFSGFARVGLSMNRITRPPQHGIHKSREGSSSPTSTFVLYFFRIIFFNFI